MTSASTIKNSDFQANSEYSFLSNLKVVNHFSNLGEHFYSNVKPVPLANPKLVDISPSAAQLIGVNSDDENDSLLSLLNGENLPESFDPISMLYAGHQFGSWVPQLGDGRAMLLAQVETESGNLWELQLKGSGPTPYSRHADGRAVLRSTIREYLCSEAMQTLGIPTTRALGLIDSDTAVYREEIETGAMLMRMAHNHIRFGSFEVFASRNQTEQVQILADHLLEYYRPELKEQASPYLALYKDIIQRTAELIADWQSVGFCHGVMNTDNMSVLGLTIDYGPFGFIESYDPNYICNHSDSSGRYAYNKQPDIAWWNLAALGNGMLPVLELEEAKEAIESYKQIYQAAFHKRFCKKLGLSIRNSGAEYQEDAQLIQDWLNLLAQQNIDFTSAFRFLCSFSKDAEAPANLQILFANSADFNEWLTRYSERLNKESIADSKRQKQMLQTNPKYILRNYLAEIAIAKAKQGDYSEVVKLRQILSKPFDEQPEHNSYANPAPASAANIQISCSS